jgi:hypothetical protein
MLPGDVCETLALGSNVMYGVKCGEQWVTVCKEDIFRLQRGQAYRKYQRLFFATRRSAQTQCDNLNKIFKTDQYVVAKV